MNNECTVKIRVIIVALKIMSRIIQIESPRMKRIVFDSDIRTASRAEDQIRRVMRNGSIRSIIVIKFKSTRNGIKCILGDIARDKTTKESHAVFKVVPNEGNLKGSLWRSFRELIRM